jgi:hypothetical protein
MNEPRGTASALARDDQRRRLSNVSPDVNRQSCSRNYVKRAALLIPLQLRETSSAMQQQHDGVGPSTSDFRDSRYDGAIRAKLGEALREKHDLMEPLAPRLLELLARLDTGIYVRETVEAKLYAKLDECVAAMVNAGELGER